MMTMMETEMMIPQELVHDSRRAFFADRFWVEISSACDTLTAWMTVD